MTEQQTAFHGKHNATQLEPRMDWKRVLDDLRDAGVSGYAVANKFCVGWSTVQGWRECKGDIGHAYGRKLLLLHAEHCGSGLTFQRLTEGGLPT